ncbi:hypothetical protein CP960_03275 [Malaciobacter halophilus]|uniref:EamA-like transporter family protein n=1 Tax=Malaciobacter halophilus TaxID=197482 RepID=A0A2N1J4Y4_9BACT|nr:DMT family transporter [Malaciobacter halophilus]AXH09608.1 putative inner membrane exporter, YdcZ family [Malaciobacter halophilus]PKI81625.1 hypothetical protein CP960_03275 [Malaciobacter halophilus]
MIDTKVFYVLLMIVAGAGMPVQAALNLYVAKWSGSFEFASMVSFFVGTLCLIFVVLLFTKVSLANLDFNSTPPTYSWFAGIIGAFVVTIGIIIAPKIGMASMILSMISGQIIMSLLIDKFGLFSFEVKDISLTKIIAVLLVILGVWLFNFEK